MLQKYEACRKFLRHIQVPDKWQKHYFAHAWIEQVVVNVRRRTWQIYIHVPQVVPPDVWKSFQERATRVFREIGQVEIHLHFDAVETQAFFDKYWYWIQKEVQHRVGRSLAGWLGQATWEVDGGKLILTFPNFLLWKMAEQKELDLWVRRLYRKLTGQEIEVVLKSRKSEG